MAAKIEVRLLGQALRWSPARVFMLVSSIWHLLLGIVGLFYDRSFPFGSAATKNGGSDHIFGIFETNGWHSVAALTLGAVSLYFVMRPGRARDAAMVIGVFHVALVAALVVWPPEVFWMASNTADQIVHASTAIGGIAAALWTRATARDH